MSPRPGLLAAATIWAALSLSGCGHHYPQIESRVLERPEPPLTPADQRALAPYQASPYFHARP